MIVRKINHLLYEVVLDTTQLLEQFQFRTLAKRYRYWDRKYEFFTTTASFYDSVDYNKIIIKVGFLPYIYKIYKDILTDKSKELILSEVTRTPLPSFENLTNEQNSQLSILTSYDRGVNQSFTGSGKTEVIATLANYCLHHNEKCIIIAPTKRACDEIRDRLLIRYSIDCSSYYNPDSYINLFNSRGFFESEKCQIEDPFWKDVKWCICDEVEKIFSNNVEDCFYEMENCSRWYGFSATADKLEGKPITVEIGSEVIGRNLRLVKYFGFTTVYNKPSFKYIEIIHVDVKRFWILQQKDKSTINDGGGLAEYYDNSLGSGYIPYVDTYFDEELALTIKRIAIKEGSMFIPLSRREILTDWLQNWWKDTEVIFINGSGYQLWKDGEIKMILSLREVKEMVLSKRIKYVFGTVSAFNSLDLVGMQNVMLLAYSSASMTLQAIGRVARGNLLRIFLPYCSKDETVIRRDYERRLKLILNYYNECKISRIYKTDSDYDVVRDETKYHN